MCKGVSRARNRIEGSSLHGGTQAGEEGISNWSEDTIEVCHHSLHLALLQAVHVNMDAICCPVSGRSVVEGWASSAASLTVAQVARSAKLHDWVCWLRLVRVLGRFGVAKFEGRRGWRNQWRKVEVAAGWSMGTVSLELREAQGSSNTRVRLGLANTTHVILIGNGLQAYQQTV